MATGRLEAIAPEHFPALGRFLTRSLADLARDEGFEGRGNTREEVDARLHWRMIANPSRGDRLLGECVTDTDGEVVASIVYTPTAFRRGDDRVMGLLGGYFFTAPTARGYGLVLLRRFLKAPGCDFAYSTSLNAASGALWSKLGGTVPRGSDRAVVAPVALRPVLDEFAARRGAPRVARAAIAAASACATPFFRIATQARRALRLEPTRDWDALAAFADRHRAPDALVADLSPAVLAWRYEASPARDRIEVLRFDAGGGRDGWLATIATRRGRSVQLRTRTVLTLVRPREPFDELALLTALRRRYAGSADLIAVGASDPPAAWRRPYALEQTLTDPPVYMIGDEANGRPWAESMRFSVGDGDAVE
jgi:hypothetical protein